MTAFLKISTLALASLFSASALSAEQATKMNEHEARTVIAAMDRDQSLLASLQRCPADLFRKEAELGGSFPAHKTATKERCAAHPAECLSACVAGRSATHCFNLALAFEQDEAIAARYKEMLFAKACALGDASGCTNRGAYLRNTMEDSDPLRRVSEEELKACQHRTFKAACRNNDNWGCAMLGQSYRYGEGTPTSQASARRAYRKACKLDPNFAACESAREDLEEMKPARH